MYNIAIPSYNRADILVKKTLATLRRNSIDEKIIKVFVADYSQFKIYEKALLENEYDIEIIIGELGIANQRNYIKKYYTTVGQHIVVIDDDVEAFEKVDENKKFNEILNINDFFITAKEYMIEEDVNLWGIYGAKNGLWMNNYKTDYSVGFYFIIGCCYGFLVEEFMTPYLVDVNIKQKEDYEQTLLHFVEKGGVLRFNKITLKTKFYQEGGLGTKKDRRVKNEADTDLLLLKYPTYFKRKVRKDGWSEVSLIKQKTKKKIN